jgi:hypothetical protein
MLQGIGSYSEAWGVTANESPASGNHINMDFNLLKESHQSKIALQFNDVKKYLKRKNQY